MMTDSQRPTDSQPQQAQPSFQIEKVFVKDLSLEIPNAPQIFTEQVKPQLEVQIATEVAKFAEAYYEVTVSATVTAKSDERTVFLAEAVQAGKFSTSNVGAPGLGPRSGIGCSPR